MTTSLPWSAALGHALLAALLGAVAAAVALAVPLPASRRPLLRYLALGAPLFVVLVAATLGSWVARRSWGMNLSGNILVEFLPHAGELAALLGWRAVAVLAGWGLLAAVPCAVWSVLLSRAHGGLGPGDRRALLAGAVVVALLAGAASRSDVVAAALPLGADPLVSLLGSGEQPSLAPTPERLAAWADDERLRRTFDAGTPAKRNVILLLADGVRPDHLSFHGYGRQTTPFLDELVRGPGWATVPVAYSAATESIGGIGAIVSGRSTRTMSARSYGMVEFFARHGAATHLLLNGEHAWYELRAMYGSRVTTYRDLRNKDADLPLHDDGQVLRWIEELPDAGAQPSFLMVFLMGTHQLSPLAEEDRFFTRGRPSVAPFWVAPGSADDLTLAVDRYDDQLRAADRHLRSIWAALARKGYLRDSVVAISSDHGQALGEHGAFGHGDNLWEPTVRVPLLLWSDTPLPPLRTDRPAWTPDLAPTLAEAAGLRPLPTWEGASLLRDSARDTLWVESALATRNMRAVLHDEGGRRLKLHQSLGADGRPFEERLFDVLADPREERDLLASTDAATLSKLRALAAATPLEVGPGPGRDSARAHAPAQRGEALDQAHQHEAHD